MPILHMETEQVRAAANQISLYSSELENQIHTLRNLASLLSISWQGASANVYLVDIDSSIQSLSVVQEQAITLSIRVYREIAEWEHADNYNVIINTIGSYDSEDTFSWIDFWRTVAPEGAKKGLNFVADTMAYADYRSVGRWLNELVGNRRGGWVGRMDELGHFIESPWVQKGIPFGLNVIFDEDFGENNLRAVAGELFVVGGTYVGTRLIPGFGTAMLISDGIQFGGNLLAGGLELAGYSDQAAWLQNNLDIIDLGGHLETLGEGIYDTATNWYQNPDQIIPDLQEFSENVQDFGSGLLETGEDIGHWFNDISSDWF